MKALHRFIKYRDLSEDYEELKKDASLQLTRLYLKLAERRTENESLEYVIKAYKASKHGNILKKKKKKLKIFIIKVVLKKLKMKQVTN